MENELLAIIELMKEVIGNLQGVIQCLDQKIQELKGGHPPCGGQAAVGRPKRGQGKSAQLQAILQEVLHEKKHAGLMARVMALLKKMLHAGPDWVRWHCPERLFKEVKVVLKQLNVLTLVYEGHGRMKKVAAGELLEHEAKTEMEEMARQLQVKDYIFEKFWTVLYRVHVAKQRFPHVLVFRFGLGVYHFIT